MKEIRETSLLSPKASSFIGTTIYPVLQITKNKIFECCPPYSVLYSSCGRTDPCEHF
jgi:hypothetical protein